MTILPEPNVRSLLDQRQAIIDNAKVLFGCDQLVLSSSTDEHKSRMTVDTDMVRDVIVFEAQSNISTIDEALRILGFGVVGQPALRDVFSQSGTGSPGQGQKD